MPLSAPHSAILNGIARACGARIFQIPALPERVLQGMKKKG